MSAYLVSSIIAMEGDEFIPVSPVTSDRTLDVNMLLVVTYRGLEG